jgi:hypothetical protein
VLATERAVGLVHVGGGLIQGGVAVQGAGAVAAQAAAPVDEERVRRPLVQLDELVELETDKLAQSHGMSSLIRASWWASSEPSPENTQGSLPSPNSQKLPSFGS